MNASTHRCGTVSLVGRPNTGKSSLFNKLVGQKVSIVSPKAQTTRHLVKGILTQADTQYIFVDSPGYQTQHRNILNRALNRRATEAALDTDVVLWMVEAPRLLDADLALLAKIPVTQCVIAVVNKMDLLKDRTRLMPLLQAVSALRNFQAIVPVSARTGRNTDELLRAIRDHLPEGPSAYADDQLTDRDERFFAADLIREKIFRLLGEELPYRCEVVIDQFVEEGQLRRIEATIWVDRDNQKAIVIGERGTRLKSIGSAARRDMETLFGGKVFLSLWVKVKRGWTDDERALRTLGYG